MNKIIVVMRGLPCTGKTSLAKSIAKENKGRVVSANDYWSRNELHLRKWSYEQIKKAIDAKTPFIVLDDNNILSSNFSCHLDYAIDCGYKYYIQEPITPIWFQIAPILIQRQEDRNKSELASWAEKLSEQSKLSNFAYSTESILDMMENWENFSPSEYVVLV